MSAKCLLRPVSKTTSSLFVCTSKGPLLARTYYSYDHAAPPSRFSPTESQILSASYRLIPSHGFTPTTLALGAQRVGYAPASTNLFPKGVVSLIEWHLEVQKNALASKAETIFSEDLQPGGRAPGVGNKVKALTWQRLLANKDIISRWQEALAVLAQPSNIPVSLSTLAALSDEIWFLAGDTSVDTSWYTKRASLSAIYAASELFMTTDRSEGFVETKEFLDRRFEDSRALGGLVGGVGEWAGFQGRAAINVLRSKGVRI